MKGPKNTELDFLYNDGKYQNSKDKTTNKTVKSKAKNTKTRAGGAKSAQSKNSFNFDNEIVIGVTRVPDNKKMKDKGKEQTKKTPKVKNENAKQKSKNIGKDNTRQKSKKRNEKKTNAKRINKTKKESRKGRVIKGVIKWTILLLALIASIIYFMMSPLFNLASVEVANNSKISTETIISLSELKIGENIFKTSSRKIQNNIKHNAYIESVKIHKKLPNKIEILVKERKATYMLEYASSFAYINNQGYILEISEEKLELPIIEDYKTDDIKEGARLNTEDLEKLETILKIMESANSNGLGNLITRINIKNKQNYYIIMEGEKKTIYLGNASNLGNRMLYLKAVLEEEKGVEGEIFINGDLNKTDVYFRIKQ